VQLSNAQAARRVSKSQASAACRRALAGEHTAFVMRQPLVLLELGWQVHLSIALVDQAKVELTLDTVHDSARFLAVGAHDARRFLRRAFRLFDRRRTQ